jgi:16S rRNA (guanine(966)-N(2))-methyltransferase RsmD
LFNVIGERVIGMRVLDAFAGTGAVGLEALSRGASHAAFIERERRALALVEENIVICGAASMSTVVRDEFIGAAGRHPRLGRFELVFVDPPYDVDDLAPVLTEAAGFLSPAGMLVLEHSRRRAAPEAVPGVRRSRLLRSGDSALAFYAPAPPG